MEHLSVDEAKALLREFFVGNRRFEKAIQNVENAKTLFMAAQLMADDPQEPDYVEEYARALIRGRAGAQAGLTPGQTVDREVERYQKDEDSGTE